MKYDLLKPCKSCPFRKDGTGVKLMAERIEEIADSTGWNGKEFACHSSLDYNEIEAESDDELLALNNQSNAQHCAGALIFGLKNGGPHQMGRICDRLGMVDFAALEKNAELVYEDLDEWLAHGTFERSKTKRSAKRKR